MNYKLFIPGEGWVYIGEIFRQFDHAHKAFFRRRGLTPPTFEQGASAAFNHSLRASPAI